MPDLVTLEVTLVDGGADASAELVWVSDAGDEQKYGDMRPGAMYRQETFPGHTWIVRGQRTRQVLLRIAAQENPPVQEHRVDVNSTPPPLDGDEADGSAGDDGSTAAGDDILTADAAGVWLGAHGMCKFVRVPPRPNSRGRVTWHEMDVDGNQVGTLQQLEARVDTRWLWWAESMYRRWTTMGHDNEFIIMSALTIAGAYHVDFTVPQWLNAQLGGKLGPSPLMLLLVLVFVGGALVAAIVPLLESTLVLHNASSRVEVRLNQRGGFQREPSNIPGRQNGWVSVCDGSFETVPPDLRAQRAQRSHHALFVGSVIVLVLSTVLKRGGSAEPAAGMHRAEFHFQ